MGRPSKAWYWAKRDTWHATVNGKRRTLARGKDKGARARAERELHRLLAAIPPAPDFPATLEGPLAREVVAMFLDHARDAVKPITLEFYKRHLEDFKKSCGATAARDIKPFHVSEWVGSHDWAPATRRGAITCVKRAFSWATKQGYLEADPVASVKKPKAARREEIPSAGAVEAMRGAIRSRAFLEFLLVLAETGCRPGEAAKVEARHFDPGRKVWVMDGKTTGATGKKRIVYLTDIVVQVCTRLAREHPTGPLLRNSQGRPWTRHAYGHQFRRLREKAKLGKEAVAYGLRHLWATDAIDRGVPIATVAEMMGHSGTRMIDEHYNHVGDRPEHFQAALEKIRPPKD